jgi:hypothetical protein
MVRYPLLGSSFILLLLSLAASAASSGSSSSPSSGRDARPPGPPPEAVAACKGKTEGTEVSFTGRNGETFTGICRNIDGTLAAMPKSGGPGASKGGGQNPPPPPR